MATRRARGFVDAFKMAQSEGREDWSRAYRTSRTEANQSEDAPRISEMSGTYPLGTRVMENLADMGVPGIKADKNRQQVRDDLGIGLQPKGKGRRAGQMLGTIANDLTTDQTRSFYWLGNAVQALGSITQEGLLGKYAPHLFGTTAIKMPNGKVMHAKKNKQLAQNEGYLDATGKPTKGIRITDKGEITKRNFDPGDKALLLIPQGFAINAGVGLMSPMGGADGYEALIPSDDDPQTTANAVAEVGLKYFTGRTGNLLPYDEFKQDRPDVSRGEYNAYKAFKYSKDTDLNPFDDGQVTLPGRLIKATADGIHGPEVQVLGKSLPLTEGIIPTVAAIAGTTYGASRPKSIRRGLQYGLGAYVAGTATGAIAEQIRRRASSNQVQLDGGQAEGYL